MAEKIEFDLTVNGKKAKTSIEQVEKAQEDLGKTTKKTTENMKTDWVGLGVKVAAVAATVGTLARAGSDLDRVMFGLNEKTRAYIKSASEQYGVDQKMIASFVQTGKSAGLAGQSIQEIVDLSVALQRANPNESLESFANELVILNRTGEAGGIIMEVLEKKFGAVDLKSISLADKMTALQEITKGVNAEFDKTSGSKLDKTIAKLSNSFDSLGSKLLSFVDSTGIFVAFNKGLQGANGALAILDYSISQVGVTFKSIFGNETQEDLDNLKEKFFDMNKALDKFWGVDRETKVKVKVETVTEEEKDPLGIVGTAKPKEQSAVEATIVAEKAKASAVKKAEQDIKNTRDKFDDDYIKSIASSSEYQLYKLGEQYLVYEKHIKDKAKLDEWFESESKKIMDNVKEDHKGVSEDIKGYFKDTFSTSLTESLLEGQASFSDFASSILKDIARIIIQKQIANAVSGVMEGGFFAQGGVIGGDSPVQKRYATGGIVTRPTRLASGGLVGERNRAEAVLPLERTANGDLGVKAGGGSSNVVINIENQTGSNIDASDITTSKNKEQETINVVLKGISKNTSGIRDLLKGI